MNEHSDYPLHKTLVSAALIAGGAWVASAIAFCATAMMIVMYIYE